MESAEQWKLWERGVVRPSWREASDKSAVLRICWFW